jgi:hypothetical protein
MLCLKVAKFDLNSLRARHEVAVTEVKSFSNPYNDRSIEEEGDFS